MDCIDIILDDDLENRKTPRDYVRFTTGNDLLDFMRKNPGQKIGTITFDNDLGLNLPQGYDVVKTMIFYNWDVSHVNIHSANVVAKNAMKQTLERAIERGMFKHVSVEVMPLDSL